MEAVAGPNAGGGAIGSLGRRGRGDVDADSMGYDEVIRVKKCLRSYVPNVVVSTFLCVASILVTGPV